MIQWFRHLDRILRGEGTDAASLRTGRYDVPIAGTALVVILLAMFYGACAGSFAPLRPGGGPVEQVLASAVKLPLLLVLTLVVTLPSLYVFSALAGSGLKFSTIVRLLLAVMAVLSAVLASLGPIVVFFALSTESYTFMKLLNVLMGLVAGLFALAYLQRLLNNLITAQAFDAHNSMQPMEPPGSDVPSAVARRPRPASIVFQIWMVVFAVVGAQMSWVLRPFIGDPDLPFQWFRQRDSNFFIDVMRAIGRLVSSIG